MIYLNNLLFYIFFIPLLGSVFLIFVSFKYSNFLKSVCLSTASLTFLLSLILCFFFDKSSAIFQFETNQIWFLDYSMIFSFGIDGVSLFFVILTTMLIPICLLISWNSFTYLLKLYLLLFLIMESMLIGVFCILDLLLFYIFFESVLIPMFLIIGIWGSRERKIRAAFLFFLYTLFGSVAMLISILYIYYHVGTTDYKVLLTFSFSLIEQKFLWLAFFLSFATKVPMLPVHLWLPEAHVEAPTSGSVILAGILLKLGTYGFIRFSLPLFPEACFYFSPFVYCLAGVGIIYTSFTAIRQTDFKRIVAYTSVAHMNFVILGIFSFNTIGIEGAILQSLSHGFVASALFMIIGVIYDRYGSRMIRYYGGLVHVMPLYDCIFLFFTMANIGLPGTSSFIGEFLILTGSFQTNSTITLIGGTSMVIGGCYSLWLFNRVSYGSLKTQYFVCFLDLNKLELLAFLPLILGTLVIGLLPGIFLNYFHMSVNNLIELIYF
jgi:proton-translocating NADH-quinone oxidoreductase chain M